MPTKWHYNGGDKMGMHVITYEVKLFSSKETRYAMKIAMNTLCDEHSCLVDLTVRSKWYWLCDIYTIKVTGSLDNIKYVEKQIKQLSLYSL